MITDEQWIYEIRQTYINDEENDFKNKQKKENKKTLINRLNYINKQTVYLKNILVEMAKSNLMDNINDVYLKVIKDNNIKINTIRELEEVIYYKIELFNSYKNDLEELIKEESNV